MLPKFTQIGLTVIERLYSNSDTSGTSFAAGEQVLGAQKTRASTVEAVAVNVNWD
jgi:hypothetical protein